MIAVEGERRSDGEGWERVGRGSGEGYDIGQKGMRVVELRLARTISRGRLLRSVTLLRTNKK